MVYKYAFQNSFVYHDIRLYSIIEKKKKNSLAAQAQLMEPTALKSEYSAQFPVIWEQWGSTTGNSSLGVSKDGEQLEPL